MQVKKCLYCENEFEDIYNRGKKFCCKNCQRTYWRKFVNPELHQKTTKEYYNRMMTDENLHEKKKEYDRNRIHNLKERYTRIKAQAKKRNYSFNISRDYYENNFYNNKCFYCGGKTIGGIDRINNNIGYEIGNIVPCCTTCNQMKNILSLSDFLSHIQKIINHTAQVKSLDSSNS